VSSSRDDGADFFSRYAETVDRRAAGFEGGDISAVPIVHPEVFGHADELSPDERRSLGIKLVALRVVCGIELRPLRELAAEIGCSHTAIDNAAGRICERIGLRKHHTEDGTRQRMKAARGRQIAAPADPVL